MLKSWIVQSLAGPMQMIANYANYFSLARSLQITAADGEPVPTTQNQPSTRRPLVQGRTVHWFCTARKSRCAVQLSEPALSTAKPRGSHPFHFEYKKQHEHWCVNLFALRRKKSLNYVLRRQYHTTVVMRGALS